MYDVTNTYVNLQSEYTFTSITYNKDPKIAMQNMDLQFSTLW
jgi:hypothetical protein